MIPKTNNVGIQKGQLTLTNNILYCSKTDDFFDASSQTKRGSLVQ